MPISRFLEYLGATPLVVGLLLMLAVLDDVQAPVEQAYVGLGLLVIGVGILVGACELRDRGW